MRTILFEGATRRWALGVVLLAGLAALLVSLVPFAGAQDNPLPPHWFWGTHLESYVGDEVVAVNQDDIQVGSSTVDSEGSWTIAISPDAARTVTLRLITDSGIRQTDLLDVIQGGFDAQGLSITDFKHRVADEIEEVGETLAVRIIARLHPTRASRTLEFNLRVNGVDIDPPPSARFLTPSLATDRWLNSSDIDAGDGYVVRIIACKQADDDVIFGLRVEGYDDIIPPRRRLASTTTHNRWLQSSEIAIPLANDNDDVVRLGRGDIGCTAEPLAP